MRRMGKNVEREYPIRVAQVVGKLWAGGVEAVVFNYYREIDKNTIQFDFYYDADSTVVPPKELIDMGARFIEIPPYQKVFIYIKTLRKYFKENDYLIVHSHVNTLSVFPLFAAWCEKIPVRIAHNHSVPGGDEHRRNFFKYFLRIFAKVFATDYFACSEKAGKWLFGKRMVNNGRVNVVRNAINMDLFRTDEEKVREIKGNLGLDNEFVVGHIGRFTYAKNHRFLIDVFERICELRDDVKLMLVGDGELRNEIVSYIIEKDILNKVIIVGQVSDPWNYYRVANIVVLPSLFEGLSLSTIESQIAGVPIVISENIPDEAIISNGCIRRNLNDDINEWVETVLSEKQEVVLNENSMEYDIKSKAPLLVTWYLERIREIKKV